MKTKMNTKSYLCRICMEDNSKNNIFRTMAAGDLIANLLIDLADIEVDCQDPLPMPTHVCDSCKVALISAYNLRKQIRSSDIFLRELFSNCDLPLPPVLLKPQKVPFESKEPMPNTSTESLPTASSGDISSAIIGGDISPMLDQTPPLSELLTEESERIEVNVELSELNDLVLDDVDWSAPSEPHQAVSAAQPAQPERIHCCRCEETFETPDEVKPHMLDVHNIDFDPKEMLKPASFIKHVTYCDLCGNRYNNSYTANQHKFQYKNQITCVECGELVKKLAIINHMKRHNDELVDCDICHKKFKKFYLSEHRKKVHFLVKKFECHYCPDKRFATKNKVRVHMQKHDSSYRMPVVAVCPYCKRTFDMQSKFVNHLVIHTGQKRFNCEHCSAAFLHKTDWRRHVWTHTGSPFTCKKCNKYMDRPSHLREHEAAGCGTRKNKKSKTPKYY